MIDLTGEVDCSKAQNETGKARFGNVRSVLAKHKMACQQFVSNYVSELEYLATERASLEVAFLQYRTNLDGSVSRLVKTFDNEMELVDEEAKERKRLFLVESGPKRYCNIMSMTVSS